MSQIKPGGSMTTYQYARFYQIRHMHWRTNDQHKLPEVVVNAIQEQIYEEDLIDLLGANGWRFHSPVAALQHTGLRFEKVTE